MSIAGPDFSASPSLTDSGADAAGDLCDPRRERFTGMASEGTANPPYCYSSSDALDDDPWLVIHSGWLGLVIDADMDGGNIIPYMGRIHRNGSDGDDGDDEYSSSTVSAFVGASSAAVAAALPAASLNCSLRVAATTYRLQRGLPQLTVAPVRHGAVVAHVLVTNLVWVAEGDEADVLEAANPDAPVWWVEVSVWATSATIQLGWEEGSNAPGGACAVCEPSAHTAEPEATAQRADAHRRNCVCMHV